MGPIIARLARRDTPAGAARLAQLKPSARYAITAWVAATVPILALNLVVMAVLAPRIIPALWTSAHTQATGLAAALNTGAIPTAANHLIELVLVAVPAAGMAYIIATLLTRITPPLAHTATRPLTRIAPHLHPRRHPRITTAALTAAVTALIVIPVTLAASHALHTPARPHPTPLATPAPITAAPIDRPRPGTHIRRRPSPPPPRPRRHPHRPTPPPRARRRQPGC